MELITLAVPSRYRPARLYEMLVSAEQTAAEKWDIEARIYLDEDDPNIPLYEEVVSWPEFPVHVRVGPRVLMSQAWNEAIADGYGDIVMLAADDLRFRSPGWDTHVREAFAKWPDRIGLVCGRDGHKDEGMATHPFVSREWIQVLGRFTPPMFSADYADYWLDQIARRIDRFAYLPEVFTEHMHVSFGKSEDDACNAEKEQRSRADRPVDVWEATANLREADALRLLECMA